MVERAVAAARRLDFGYSCRPQQGELLRLLAAGIGPGTIGETGTGCGVGLAWLASGAPAEARLVSVERDPVRAAVAAELFRTDPRVRVVTGDWRDLAGHGPFDLLVLDGGGAAKDADPPVEPGEWLRGVGAQLVIDDFTPLTTWPPRHEGREDAARLHWLRHPRLRASEVRVAPSASTILATFVG
jgi:predicted O-methyltransferase YrrM